MAILYSVSFVWFFSSADVNCVLSVSGDVLKIKGDRTSCAIVVVIGWVNQRFKWKFHKYFCDVNFGSLAKWILTLDKEFARSFYSFKR